jgi:mRNA interferase MazF
MGRSGYSRGLVRAALGVRRGEVWWADLPAPWDRRLVLLLSRDEAYAVRTWVLVAPLTTNIRNVPTSVELDPAADGVPRPCVVNLDHLQAIRRDWLDEQMGALAPREDALHRTGDTLCAWA